MGIQLKNHITYDINNWITKEEAEALFVAAGYQKIENHLTTVTALYGGLKVKVTHGKG